VTTMALALGANTLAFALTKSFLAASFGMPEADRLYVIAPVRSLPGRGDVVFAEAYANYALLREVQRSFADLAVMSQGIASWNTGDEARPLQSARISASFFTTTRVQPALGRAFRKDEEGPGAAPVAIISHALWRGALAGDPGVLGRTMEIDGSAYTVVGVMPPGFSHPLPTDLWLPFDLANPTAWTAVTGGRSLAVYGRLGNDATFAAARAEMDALTRAVIEANPDNRDYRYVVQSIREYLVPGAARILLFVQLGATLLVLLAIANLSSLLVAWGFDRRQEISVRLALGAGHVRVVRLLVMQSLTVVGMGGVLALLITGVATPLVRGLDVSPALGIYLSELHVDVVVLLVSALVVATSGVLAGLLPAWLAGRADPAVALRSAGRTVGLSPAAMRWQQAMVAAQATLSVFIVSVAVLIGASFRNLGQVRAGFRPGDLVVARIQLTGGRYGSAGARAAFGNRLLENLALDDRLVAWSFTSTLPVGDPGWGGRFYADAADAGGTADPLLFHFRRISAGYTEAMGIPLERGRTFDAHDDSASTAVAVVSHSLVQRLWPGEDPIGRRLYRFQAGGPPVPLEIVGVVGDVQDGGLTAPAGETVYVHWSQVSVGSMSIIAASNGSPGVTLDAIRTALHATDPDIAASNTATLRSLANQANALPRLQTILLSAFALVALAMILLGGYGVMSQFVLSREREFALRLLFGARPSRIAMAVLVQSAKMTVAGVSVGLLLVWLAGSLMEPLVFGVAPRSLPILFAVAAGILLLTSLAALSPAVRATTADIRNGAIAS
jgi:putative ABC transport system permease protein